uniref:Armadillo repeat containing 4 n=1 Tax=Neogobius melanostomus TaxID=47308 RepID=A0A8C6S616_9GOBI
MGSALTRAAQWTPGESGSRTLAPTPLNETLLSEILQFVEELRSAHPEAAESVFVEPLQWSTALQAEDLQAGYRVSESGVESEQQDGDGRALLLLSPPNVSVRTFSLLSELLYLSNDKLAEVRAGLQGQDQRRRCLYMCHKCIEYPPDRLAKKYLLYFSNHSTTSDSGLLLRKPGRGGFDIITSLLSIRSAPPDFEFANGCRAPPHRQLLGEMAYIEVEPYDAEPFSATYSQQGVFLNKGVKQYDADESDYERTSETFEDLTSLLKKQSGYFALNLHKEVEKCSGSKGNVSLFCLCSRSRGRSRLKDVLSESSPESEEEEELERRPDTNTDLPSEQLRLQKLIKYLREGDQTVTVLTMCSLMEFNLRQEAYQLAVRDLGGLEILLNILDTKEIRCIIGALKILRLVSLSPQIQRSMVKMRGVQSLVPLLDIQLPELQALAAETLANVAKFRKARRTVRHSGGIDKLVSPLPREEQDVEAARCGALALWSCSRSSRNKEAIRKAGGIPLLGRLLRSSHTNMLIPVIGTLQECASEESYRQAIRSEGMIKDLVKNLSRDNDELQMHSASAIFKCAEDEKTRELIYQYKGPQRLAQLLSKADNKPLLAAATGAIWKCSLSQKNVTKFQEHRVLESLVALMSEQPEEVLVNVVAALGEFAQIPANKAVIGQSGGIQRLVRLLTGRNQALLVNVTRTLGVCATDMKNMAIIDQLDGLRLVWSLLKNPSPEVQASAAWALCPIIENGKDVGESMRRLIGGFQLLIKLLKSTDSEVLASICAVIAKITEDKEENVALLTDYGVVPLLANLTCTTDDRLRRHLAEAIAYCCMWSQNRAAFGQAGAVAPLVRYVKSQNGAVHDTTVVALYQLSKDVDNCITLHANAVVQVRPCIRYSIVTHQQRHTGETLQLGTL